MPKTKKDNNYKTVYTVSAVSPFRHKDAHPDHTLNIEADNLAAALELAKDQVGEKEGAEGAEDYTYQSTGVEQTEAVEDEQVVS